jgi:membrane-associated phospholipid phosphatase
LKVSIVVLVIAWVALVGIARIALGEHFPSDVLAGLFGGLGALGIYGWLTRPGGFADRPRDA